MTFQSSLVIKLTTDWWALKKLSNPSENGKKDSGKLSMQQQHSFNFCKVINTLTYNSVYSQMYLHLNSPRPQNAGDATLSRLQYTHIITFCNEWFQAHIKYTDSTNNMHFITSFSMQRSRNISFLHFIPWWN